jgi:hypothetical protein
MPFISPSGNVKEEEKTRQPATGFQFGKKALCIACIRTLPELSV